MTANIIRVFGIILIGVTLVNIIFYILQPRLIFFPILAIEATPKHWGIEYEEVFFNSSDGVQLHGWYIPAGPQAKTVLYFHGNAGNISHRRSVVELYQRLGISLFLFDYRGYGNSNGKPSESGLYNDARAAWRFLTVTKAIPAHDIVLVGRSLGAAIATDLAKQVSSAGLVLESAFSSLRQMGNIHLPVLSMLLLARYDFKTVEKLPLIKTPVLLIHSRQDEIIPYSMAQSNFHAANKPKFLTTVNGGHNDWHLMDREKHRDALQRFIH